MAGKPGRSGGVRPGAGRKPATKPAPEAPAAPADPVSPLPATDDPLVFLLAVMNNAESDQRLRVRAAIAAAQYKHVKRDNGGKRDDQAAAAKKAGTGKYRPASAPLKLVGTK